MITTVAAIMYAYKNYYLTRKPPANGVSFENPSYMKDGATVQIQDSPNQQNGNGIVDNNRNKSHNETTS